jgi:hypothetical protein
MATNAFQLQNFMLSGARPAAQQKRAFRPGNTRADQARFGKELNSC